MMNNTNLVLRAILDTNKFKKDATYLKTELDSINTKVKQTGTEMSGTQKKVMDNNKKVTDDIVKKTEQQKKALLSLSKIATTSMIALGTSMIKDMDQMSSQLVKRANMTKEEIEKIKPALKESYKLGFDADEIGTAYSELSVGLKLEGDDLQHLSDLFLKFSKITDESINELIDTGARTIKGWEIDKSGWDDFIGYILKTSQETGIEATRLLTALSDYSDPLSLLGFSWQESSALIGSLYSSGANMRAALSGLRYAVSSFAEAGIQDIPGALNQAVQDIKEATESDALAMSWSIFGKAQAADMTRIIKRGDFDAIEDIMDSIAKNQDTIDDVFERAKTVGDKYKELLNELKVALEPLGQAVLNILEFLHPILETIIQSLGIIIEALSMIPGPMLEILTFIFLWDMSIGKLGGGVFNLWDLIMGMFKGASGGATSFFGLLTSNSLLSIAALGAVALAIAGVSHGLDSSIDYVKSWGYDFLSVIGKLLSALELLGKKAISVFSGKDVKYEDLWSTQWSKKTKGKAEDLRESAGKKSKKNKITLKSPDKVDPNDFKVNRKKPVNFSEKDKLQNVYDEKLYSSKEAKRKAKEEEKRRKELEKLRKKQEREEEKRRKEEERRQEELARKRRRQLENWLSALEQAKDKHKSITDELKNYVGIFDKVTNKQLRAENPYKLLRESQMRQRAYVERQNVLEQLRRRGISNEMYEEFKGMGIDQLGHLKGLAQMSQSDFNKWMSNQSYVEGMIQREASQEVQQLINIGEISVYSLSDRPDHQVQAIGNGIYSELMRKGINLTNLA